jgi:UDP-2,3-diacylglucosamine pyrophosphatase LpxH
LQTIDKSHGVARFAKRSSKTFLRCAQKVQDQAIEYARKRDYDIVSCGHTHLPIAVTDTPVQYFNSGSWTERPCHYLTVEHGVVELCSYNEEIPVFVEQPDESREVPSMTRELEPAAA